MRRGLSVIGLAFRLWWREVALLTALNLAWLALQIPIVTGPAATAAMYSVARRLADDEVLLPRHAWDALRQMLAPAWRWGAVNLLIVLALVVNFTTYASAGGWLWSGLRFVWGILALLWFALNLFYWPFWLAQSDQRLVTTLRNCLLLYVRAPAFGLTVLSVCLVLVVAGVLLTLPLAAGLMAWLALIGVLAVDTELKAGPATALTPDVELENL